MKMLLWSDVQCSFSNIAECQIALRELLRSVRKYKPDVIIHGGDAKDDYSPIPQSVIKEVVRQTKAIVATGVDYHINLGNHDRESQSPDARNWLSVLAAAGARVHTKPGTVSIDGMAVAFLPFMADRTKLIEAAKSLSGDVLIFHNEIYGTTPGKGGVSLEDLGVDRYTAAFGGHIHNHQKIGDRTWYIGSPFCQDWSEANYSKGHLIVDVTDGKVHVSAIRTKIPHWYDAGFLAENGIKPERGAYVRSKIVVSTKKISDQLENEEKRILKKFGDVRVHTVPELEKITDDLVLKGKTDRDRVAQYVVARTPDSARFEAAKAAAYMTAKLEGLKEHLVAQSVRFEFARGKNVLSFDHFGLKLANRGLVLIKGVNGEGRKRSNGSGKTNLLNAIVPIPMFGETLKRQKSDEWASERSADTAEVHLRLTDSHNRRIDIYRQRRPHALRLKIDDVDKSSGLRGNTKKLGDTQGRIERVTGYDMQTLMNAVFIDQSVANGFLFGTQSLRMDLVSRFQNLERFDAALKLVNADVTITVKGIEDVRAVIEGLEARVDGFTERLTALSAVPEETHWTSKLNEAKANLQQMIEHHAAISAAKRTYDEMQQDVDEMNRDLDDLMSRLARLSSDVSVAVGARQRGMDLVRALKCPTCGQRAKDAGRVIVAEAKERVVALRGELKTVQASKTKLQARIDEKVKRIEMWETDVENTEGEIDGLRDQIAEYEHAQGQEAERNASNKAARAEVQSQLHLARRVLRAARRQYTTLSIDRELLEFAKKAFHRSGMPIYLSMALCPVLNSAAEEYSEVFTDGKLKVSFKVEDGEFHVDVINPSGSQTVKGQSVGEAAMAGIIAAFALREAAPKTNLLVLDEPGHGLDQEGARQFAHGLLKLKSRFESILLVTHSPAIESVLAGEHLWMVTKQAGKSSLSIVN